MHWRRKWQPTPVFLPGESHGRRSLVGCSPWGGTELDTTEATWQRQRQYVSVNPQFLIYPVSTSMMGLGFLSVFINLGYLLTLLGLLWWLSGKETVFQCKRCGFDPWIGRSPGEGNGNPLQYSCLGNPMDRGDLALSTLFLDSFPL